MNAPEISTFLQQRIDANDFPSAVYLVAEKGEVKFRDALGLAVVEPVRIAAADNTIYDLASLTKPLVTGLLTAKLIETGEIRASDSVSKYLDSFSSGEKDGVTVAQLLTHTSKFPPWKPFYLFVEKPSQVLPEIAATPLVQYQDDVTYSDLNFVTLAAIIEKLTGETLDAAFARLVLPLHLADTAFNPAEDLKPRIAASEKGNQYELNTCREMYPDVSIRPNVLRERMIWGEVHDGNAWFMNGVAGHAGLFSTAAEVFAIAQQFLRDHTIVLKSETCELFRTNFTKGLNEGRSHAFQLAETPDSTAGSRMPPQSFGHLGFTGTSLWIDPIRDRIFILLTNRTHAHPLPFANINSVRRRYHDLANALLDKQI